MQMSNTKCAYWCEVKFRFDKMGNPTHLECAHGIDPFECPEQEIDLPDGSIADIYSFPYPKEAS